MRARHAAPLALALVLALPGVASAAVRCVGTSGGDCTATYATTTDAVTAATDGVDTIRFGTGAFGPVDTLKVLRFVGAGPASTTVASSDVSGKAMNLRHGGDVRNLRAQGGPGDTTNSAGSGISFGPFDAGDFSLLVDNVVGTGGTPGSASQGGAGLAIGDTSPSGTKTATVTNSTFKAGPGPSDAGLAVYTCCIKSTLTNVSISSATEGIYASLGSDMTVRNAVISGQNAVQTQAPHLLTLSRARVSGSLTGVATGADSFGPTHVVVRDSLLTTTSNSSLAPVWIRSNTGMPVTVELLGSTMVGPSSETAVFAQRVSDSSPEVTTTLRNSIARSLLAGTSDLYAERTTIGADYSSFNSRQLVAGGNAPAPGSGHNVAGDPLLAGDFSLLPASPLVDRGDPGVVEPGELDLAGAARAQDGNGDCVALPDIGAFERPDTCPPNKAPTLSGVSETNKVFAPVRKGGHITRKRKVKRGTRFRYTLSEPARVSIAIERALKGRKRGKRCVKPTRKNRKARRCTRYKRVSTLRGNKKAGKQTTPFTGRVKGRALKRGRYRARLTATDAQGAKSKERRLSFRIVRG